MLDVLLTVDTEVWPPDIRLWSKQWEMSPGMTARAFDAYIICKTPDGNFGLPYQIRG